MAMFNFKKAMANKILDRRTLGKIEAYDTQGNKFERLIEVWDKRDAEGESHIILSFDGHATYYLAHLKEHTKGHPLCIDAAGRNHRGHPVYVSAEDFALCVAAAIQITEQGITILDLVEDSLGN